MDWDNGTGNCVDENAILFENNGLNMRVLAEKIEAPIWTLEKYLFIDLSKRRVIGYGVGGKYLLHKKICLFWESGSKIWSCQKWLRTSWNNWPSEIIESSPWLYCCIKASVTPNHPKIKTSRLYQRICNTSIQNNRPVCHNSGATVLLAYPCGRTAHEIKT